MSEFEKLITERNFRKVMLGEVGKTKKKLLIVPKWPWPPPIVAPRPAPRLAGKAKMHKQSDTRNDHVGNLSRITRISDFMARAMNLVYGING